MQNIMILDIKCKKEKLKEKDLKEGDFKIYEMSTCKKDNKRKDFLEIVDHGVIQNVII
jgi:hypothetical protein